MKRLQRGQQIPNGQDWRIDVGRAVDESGRSCTFIRVVHMPSGKSRHVVGLKGRSGSQIEFELANEIIEELKAEGMGLGPT